MTLKADRTFEGWVRHYLSRYGATVAIVGVTILVTLTAAIASNPAGGGSLSAALLFGNVGQSILLWMGISLVLVPVVLWYALERRRRAKSIDSSLSAAMLRSVPPYLRLAAKDRYAFGTIVTVRAHPNPAEGWKLKEVEFRVSEAPFELPSGMKAAYNRFVEDNRDSLRLYNDGTNYMIARSPTAFTDSPELVLEARKTQYSVCRFYQAWAAGDTQRLEASALEAITPGEISFPASTAIHCLVVTKDDRLLVIKRPPDVGWYPNHWSPTVDENVSEDDLRFPPDARLGACLARGLLEELSIAPPDDFEPMDARILSVFLEGSLPTVGLCAYVPLRLTYDELKTKFVGRQDIEFSEERGIPIRELSARSLHGFGACVPMTEYGLMMLMLHTDRDLARILI
ncbi:MAG TPA: hypothetical protein VMV28_05150 [Thermoplasmata archaeon]|nr:hypothetical protein [Thermoplasmata archaeon]